ncbi:MAG: GH3 auxin-responsive promoter family protein [Promethearchaeota archaeon]
MLSREAVVKAFYDKYCIPTIKRLENPAAAQQRCLRRILKRCKDTVFGKKHSFADIKSIEDFQREVPITTYEDMKLYTARCIQGEENILFPDKTVSLVMTGGTAGSPKLYPLSSYRVEEIVMDGLRAGAYSVVHSGHYDVMDGKILVLTTPPRLGDGVGGYDVAFMTGALGAAQLPPQLQRYQSSDEPRRVPPREVDKITDWDKKFYITARYAVAEDIRSAAGLTSNTVSLLRKIKAEYLDRLLEDPELDNETKVKLRKISQDGIVDLQELWPNFRIFSSGGVSITPYRRIIHDLLGDVSIWESYGATEASLGFQVFADKGIIPPVDTTFFEFIPDEEEGAEPIPLSDVKQDTLYRVLVTTNGGFYRYAIGDIITFSELDPPVYGEISRKGALVSLAGERMSEEVILRALDRACEQHGIGFVEFALLPEVTSSFSRYLIFVEFTQPPSDLEEFTAVVDEQLIHLNMSYAPQRQANVISLPVIIKVKPGGFESLLQKQEKVLGSGKVPHLLTPELSRLLPTLN